MFPQEGPAFILTGRTTDSLMAFSISVLTICATLLSSFTDTSNISSSWSCKTKYPPTGIGTSPLERLPRLLLLLERKSGEECLCVTTHDGNSSANLLSMLTMAVFTKSAADPWTVVFTACRAAWLCACVFGEFIAGRNLFRPVTVLTKPLILHCSTVSFKYLFTPTYREVNLSMNKAASSSVRPSCSPRAFAPIP